MTQTLDIIKADLGSEAVDNLMLQIKDICLKTVLLGWPHLEHNYRTCMSRASCQNNRQCFQILGLDIMLDKKLKPWLLEVNESPSFNDDTDIDKKVKGGLIEDTLRLLDIKKSTQKRMKELSLNSSVI